MAVAAVLAPAAADLLLEVMQDPRPPGPLHEERPPPCGRCPGGAIMGGDPLAGVTRFLGTHLPPHGRSQISAIRKMAQT